MISKTIKHSQLSALEKVLQIPSNSKESSKRKCVNTSRWVLTVLFPTWYTIFYSVLFCPWIVGVEIKVELAKQIQDKGLLKIQIWMVLPLWEKVSVHSLTQNRYYKLPINNVKNREWLKSVFWISLAKSSKKATETAFFRENG